MGQEKQRIAELLLVPGILEKILGAGIQGKMILIHDKAKIVTKTYYANQRAAEIVGVPVNSLLDANPGKYLIPADDKLAEIELIKNVLAGKLVELPLKLKDINDQERAVSVKMELISENNDTAYIYCLITDLTEKEQLIFELQQREQFLFRFLEGLPAIVFMLEEDGTISFANKMARNLTGYEQSHIGWLNVMSILDKTGQQQLMETRKEIESGADSDIKYYQLISSTGEIISVEATAVTVVVGSETKFVGLAIDVSDKIKAEEERTKMMAKMIQAQKLEGLGVMAGGIAHDFNNILQGATGYLDMLSLQLRESNEIAESFEEYLKNIRKAIDRAVDLANQMMAYAGINRVAVKTFQVNDLVKEMFLIVGSSISKRAQLELNLGTGLPYLTGDITQIRQVVMNLIINASEALTDQSGQIMISTCLENQQKPLAHDILPELLPPGQYVVIEVKDTGCGMDDLTVSKMFDPFFSTKFAGRGLGLAAVLGIVNGHKGSIHVNSEPGIGTSVKVYFPVEQNQEIQSGQIKTQANKIFHQLADKKVLLITDDNEACQALQMYLSSYGCTVFHAANGRTGLDLYLVNYQTINLLIIDLNLPDIDSQEVLAEIKKQDSSAKIILISGYAEKEAMKKFANGDIADFFAKPLEYDQLLPKLIKVLA